MSYAKSKCLGSNRGTLRVAAYCFKHLKKPQLLDADISSSVDKILHDEMNGVSYRVLAYLLLGVVKIYSKKVEYLLHDCNEVLIRIKKFLIKTKDNAPAETLRMSIIIPDRFELDAFDLDILEDDGRGHIAAQEEITLKDVLCNTEGSGQVFADTFEKFDFCQNSSTADLFMEEDVYHSHQMDLDNEVFLPNSPSNSMEGKDILQNSIFSPKEPMKLNTDLLAERVEKELVNSCSQDQQINEDPESHINVPCEEILEESRITGEGSVDASMFFGRENGPVLSVEAFNESCHVDGEQSTAMETSSSLCQIHQNITQVQESRNLQESTERPQEDKSYPKECMDYGKSSVTEEILEEHIEGSVEQHEKERKIEFQEKVLFENEKLNAIQPDSDSKNLDVTPQSKFQGGSVRKPKPGAIRSEFMLISTPAVRERALFSRKSKIVIDGMLILSNEELRKSIRDTSDLISNRRRFRRTSLAVQRQSRISHLPEGFYESSFPCCSQELRFLFSRKKMKLSDSFEIVKTQDKLDGSESRNVGSPEHNETAPQSPPDFPCSLETEEIPGKLDVSESHAVGSQEHIETAPRTPPRFPKVKVRSIEQTDRMEIQNYDNLGLSSPLERIDREQSLKRDEELNLMEEEINSCETENSELLAGWSERTRRVAKYLHRSFLDLRKQREEEVVNFSQVLERRIRKECARLFYEILVMKTTSYVDVKQKYAYGDIAVRKLPKLDQTFLINDQ